MTPAEVITEATIEHWLDTSQADADGNNPCICGQAVEDWDLHWADLSLEALAKAGLVVVSAEALRVRLGPQPKSGTSQYMHADGVLRAALPERTETDG